MIFDSIDGNGSGVIDVHELKRKFIELGLDARVNNIKDMISVIDNNNSGQLDFDEFSKLMTTSSMITGAELAKFKNIFQKKIVRI